MRKVCASRRGRWPLVRLHLRFGGAIGCRRSCGLPPKGGIRSDSRTAASGKARARASAELALRAGDEEPLAGLFVELSHRHPLVVLIPQLAADAERKDR